MPMGLPIPMATDHKVSREKISELIIIKKRKRKGSSHPLKNVTVSTVSMIDLCLKPVIPLYALSRADKMEPKPALGCYKTNQIAQGLERLGNPGS
jgi:hypothetical protein